MSKKTLNQLLAENLAREMRDKKISAKKLGEGSGLSPRTIANYLDTDALPTSTGKERSAKLAEIEKIANALNIEPIMLLSDVEDVAERASRVAAAVTGALRGPRLASSQAISIDTSPVVGSVDASVSAARKRKIKHDRNQN